MDVDDEFAFGRRILRDLALADIEALCFYIDVAEIFCIYQEKTKVSDSGHNETECSGSLFVLRGGRVVGFEDAVPMVILLDDARLSLWRLKKDLLSSWKKKSQERI